jgi:hypothetical protein
VAWVRSIPEWAKRRPTAWIPVSIATVSEIWLLAACFYPTLAGDYYSNFRFAVLDGNFLLSVVLAGFSLRGVQRLWTCTGCLLLSLAWSFIAAINLVV